MSGSTPADSIVPSSRRRASGTLAASRRKWSDHQMLMLQPPGRGSTYRYVLPRVPVCKHTVDVMPPIRAMCPAQPAVYVGRPVPEGDLPVEPRLADLPYGGRRAGAMMSPP